MKKWDLFPKKPKYLFLDEINSKSMWLISEIISKHTYPLNVSFIAASNPYRQRDDRKIENNGLNFVNGH